MEYKPSWSFLPDTALGFLSFYMLQGIFQNDTQALICMRTAYGLPRYHCSFGESAAFFFHHRRLRPIGTDHLFFP